jgi:DNA-binding transcriptional ArsR family regulator
MSLRPTQDHLTLTFMALSDPTRRAILAKLAKGEATVQELSKPFDMSGPAITKHLNVLENAGLISRSRDAQRRPCKLEIQNLKKASDWINEYRQHWEASFDRLDAYLNSMTSKKIKNKKGAKYGLKK